MNFEDELRATMRGHDAEAPRVADLPPRPWRRRRPPTWLLAAAAAVVVAAIAVPVAVLNGSGAAQPSAAGPTHHSSISVHATAQDLAPCPTKYRGTGSSAWVPALPSGVDGSARLVPQTTPAAAVVCAYLHGRHEALTGQKTLTSGLADLATQLTWLPREVDRGAMTCTTDFEITDNDSYLVQLQYPTGRVWVAVDGYHCSGASNGAFATGTNLRAATAAAYRSGRWSAAQNRTTCAQAQGGGRFGEDQLLVPLRPSAVTICDARARQLAAVNNPRKLVDILDQLPTTISSGNYTCVVPGHGAVEPAGAYGLHFHYTAGPDIIVLVYFGSECSHNVQSGALQSTNASLAVPEIRRLIRQQ